MGIDMKSHEDFFKKALEIQAQKREKLSEAEKKEIAEQLGFSEADWQAVLDSFEAHRVRGTEFLKRNNYEKAIAELEEALIIQPEHAPTLAALAKAYLGVFQTKKRSTQKEKALQYAQECLQYDPVNEAAHQVIDFFNPNKSLDISQKVEINALKGIKNLKEERVKTALAKAKKLEEKQAGIFRTLGKLYPLFLMLFFVGAWWTFPSSPHKSTQKKTSTPSTTQGTANSETQTQEQTPNPIIQKPKNLLPKKREALIPITFAPLKGRWKQKHYQIKQIDTSTWQLETHNQIPLIEFYLKEDEWRIWEVSKPKKVAREEYLARWEVKILCDSIQHDKLRFNFSAYDGLNAQEKPFFTNKEPIYLANEVPLGHIYPKGSAHRFYLQIPYFDLKDLEAKRGFGKKAARVQLEIIDFQTVVPEKPSKKPLKISFEKNVSPTNPLKFWEQKNTFFKEHNHWEAHLWTIEVENTHPQLELATLEVQIFFWDKNGKLIADKSYHYLVNQYDIDGYIQPQSSKRFDLISALGERTAGRNYEPILASEVARYEMKVMRLAWVR
ncbi:MAG: hypothetical protein OHK0053_08260 [Microscillaceae bacterium]